MPVINTDIGNLKENAKRLRFETSTAIPETNVQDAIDNVQAQAVNPPSPTATSVSATPYAVLATDRILEVEIVPCQINLDPASERAGRDLIVKDVTGNADDGSNEITITPNGVDVGGIDGLPSVKIQNPYGGVRVRPSTLAWRMDP